VAVGTASVRIAGVSDEPRRRLHQDVVTVHDRKEDQDKMIDTAER
jgi:hypothetical protein